MLRKESLPFLIPETQMRFMRWTKQKQKCIHIFYNVWRIHIKPFFVVSFNLKSCLEIASHYVCDYVLYSCRDILSAWILCISLRGSVVLRPAWSGYEHIQATRAFITNGTFLCISSCGEYYDFSPKWTLFLCHFKNILHMYCRAAQYIFSVTSPNLQCWVGY